MTFPAHQGLIIAAKLRWPRAIDATALCIGAAAPDLAYAAGPWLNKQSHEPLGIVVWAVPITLIASWLVRWRAGRGIARQLPDLGPFRLRSYAVVSDRRPRFRSTLASAALGAVSHIVIDAFTHAGRWGADLAGLNDVVGEVPVQGEMTEARVLQYIGHGLGSLMFAAALILIASQGRLNTWYDPATVQRARQYLPTSRERATFWTVALVPPLIALAVAPSIGSSQLFLPISIGSASTIVAGCLFNPESSGEV